MNHSPTKRPAVQIKRVTLSLLASCGVSLLSSGPWGQALVRYLSAGDSVTEGSINNFTKSVVDEFGDRMSRGFITTNSGSIHEVLITEGVVVLEEGVSTIYDLATGTSDTVDDIGDFDAQGGSAEWYTLKLDNGDHVVTYNEVALLRSGVDLAPNLLEPYKSFPKIRSNGDLKALVHARSGPLGSNQTLLLIEIDSSYNILSSQVVAQVGQLLAGYPVKFLQFGGLQHSAISKGGKVLFVASRKISQGVADLGIFLWENGVVTTVALLGDPSPVPGVSFDALGQSSIDVNDAGQVAFVSRTTGQLDMLVTGTPGNLQYIAAVGSPVPDPTLSGTMTSLGNSQFGVVAPVYLTEGGDVVWYGEWTNTTAHSGLFINDRLLVEANVAVDNYGQTISTISDKFDEVHLGPAGRWLFFEGSSGGIERLYSVDLGISEKIPGCYNNPGDLSLASALERPWIGSTTDFVASGGQPLSLCQLKLSTSFANVPPGTPSGCGLNTSFGELLIGPTYQTLSVVSDGLGQANFAVAIPNDPNLVGLSGYSQAGYITTPVVLTNGIKQVFGYQ